MLNCFIPKLRLKFHPIRSDWMRGMAYRKHWPIPPNFSHIEMPAEDERKLVALEPLPSWHGVRARKFPRQLHDIRGPELVNNRLIHNQYGIVALTGVQLAINHIQIIERTINKFLDTSKMFAVWRIEAPWKPVSKKPQGKKGGGGKAPIHHYVTPIRAGQILVEVGGKIEFEEVYFFLEAVAKRMPCDAFPVSKELLDHWEKEYEELNKNNINPYTFERIIKKNMQGCHQWLSPYEKQWFGKFT